MIRPILAAFFLFALSVALAGCGKPEPTIEELDTGGHLTAGRALHAVGRLEEAVTKYGDAIQLKPNFTHAYSERGIALVELERWQEAEKDLVWALHLYQTRSGPLLANKGLVDTYLNQGIAYYNMSEWRKSEYALDRALILMTGRKKITGTGFEVRSNFYRGLVELRQDRIPLGIQFFDGTIKLDPQHFEAYTHRAYGHAMLGHSDLAQQDVESAVALGADRNIIQAEVDRLLALPPALQ